MDFKGVMLFWWERICQNVLFDEKGIKTCCFFYSILTDFYAYKTEWSENWKSEFWSKPVNHQVAAYTCQLEPSI